MIRLSVVRLPLGLAVCFFACFFLLSAQGTTASILGTIFDVTGAVVPGVDITATHVDTGATRIAVSNEAGNYAFRNLPIGRYHLTGELPGFKKAEVTDIVLLIDQTASIDLQLETGEITELVTVEGSTLPLLNKVTSDIGEVVTNQRIVELPLNQREFLQLARLAPGVAPAVPGTLSIRDQGGDWAAIQASGLRVEYTTVTINGIINVDAQNNSLLVRPSIDAIQEFKIQTSNFSNELPSKGGAVINLVIKSGTNDFHGSVFEFNRNSAYRARSFFETGEIPNFNQNQFGGTIGGPIWKDKTFFFVSYENRLFRRPRPVVGSMPTADQRRGIFDPNRFGIIYDPLTFDQDTLTRQPFPDNTIPENRISSISRQILEFVPLPNAPDPLRNFQDVVGNEDDLEQVHVRVDHSFSRDTFMFNFNISDHRRLFLGGLEPFLRTGFGKDALTGGLNFANQAQHWNGGHTHIFSPGLINEVRLGVIRWEYNRLGQNSGTNFANDIFGIPGSETRDEFTDFIGLSVTGYNLPSENTQSRYRNMTYQLGDHLSWVKGDHNIKTGLDWYLAPTFNQNNGASGSFSFNGQYVSASREAPNGDGFAQFLLGTPHSMNRLDRRDFGYHYGHSYGFYFQDDWRVNKRLTLNLGFRYDYSFPIKEKNDKFANWDPLTGELVYATGVTLEDCDPETRECVPFVPPFAFRIHDKRTLYPPDKGNWAPKIGFAYELTPRTVLRGAYGIFNSGHLLTRHELLGSFNAPFMFSRRINTDLDVPNASFEQGFAGPDLIGVGGIANLTWAPRPFQEFHNAYSQMWNLGFQHELSTDLMLDLAYVGTKGTHGTIQNAQNVPPPGPGNLQERRPFPDFGNVIQWIDGANSNYHSFQLKLNKRFSDGLGINVAYTGSKAIDNASGDLGGQTDSASVENPFNWHATTRGLAYFDLPHRFVFSYIWEVPGPTQGFVKHVAGGWQMTGIWTFQSGWPFTPSASRRTNNGTGSRPDRICDGALDNPSIDRWFDLNCFVIPEIFTYGNSGRTILRTDSLTNLDMGFFKNFPWPLLGEQGRLQFRAEFYNLFNHPTFGPPQRNISSSQAGIVSTSSLGREIQFGFKLIF